MSGGLILRQTSTAFEPHGLGVLCGPDGVVGIEVGVVAVAVGVVGVAVVVVGVAVGAVGVIDVMGHMQQSSEESKLGKVVLSQPSLTHTRSPKQSSSLSQSPWPSPH